MQSSIAGSRLLAACIAIAGDGAAADVPKEADITLARLKPDPAGIGWRH